MNLKTLLGGIALIIAILALWANPLFGGFVTVSFLAFWGGIEAHKAYLAAKVRIAKKVHKAIGTKTVARQTRIPRQPRNINGTRTQSKAERRANSNR